MKKRLLALLTLCFVLGGTCGCDLASILGGKNSADDASSITSDADELKFENLLDAQAEKTLAVGQTVSYTVNKELGDRNYMKVEFTSDVNLYGEFIYCDLADTSKVVSECFFLEAGETEFKQFLDAYRPNGIGLFEKRLQSVTLQNVGESAGAVTLKGVSVSDRDIPEGQGELFLEKNSLKVGIDLALGGSITYVSRTDYAGQTVDEILDKDGNVKYGIDMKSEAGAELLSSEVNLVAIYDPGRQIQQSYYAEVGGTDDKATGANGYQRGWCYTDSSEGDWWSYNPVQAGDCADNPSQLIDYEITDNQIYVKARPMDWGKGWKDAWAGKYEKKAAELGGIDKLGLVKGGVTTKSYVENWYAIKGGALYVDNQFIDWNGFTDMENVTARNNEIPAFFPTHTLHTFVTYTGMGPWGGDEVGLFRSKNPQKGASQQLCGTENWFAWVNEQNFGMGLYVPNIDYYAYSKIAPSAHKDATLNAGARTCPMVMDPYLLQNKPLPESNYTSCYVFNACYTAPVVAWTMQEYKTMKYQYVLAVDYLTVMRSKFYDVHDSGEITNETLDAWRK